MPALARFPVLQIDGVPRDLGDVAVLPHPEPFPGGLPWSLQVAGQAAARLRAAVPTLASGWPGPATAARLLDALRLLFLRAGEGRPKFWLTTIDRVEMGPTHVRLVGTCAPILLGVREASTPVF
jgi:hypothetical protein